MKDLSEFLGPCQESKAICEQPCRISDQHGSSHPASSLYLQVPPYLGQIVLCLPRNQGSNKTKQNRTGEEDRNEFYEPKMRV